MAKLDRSRTADGAFKGLGFGEGPLKARSLASRHVAAVISPVLKAELRVLCVGVLTGSFLGFCECRVSLLLCFALVCSAPEGAAALRAAERAGSAAPVRAGPGGHTHGGIVSSRLVSLTSGAYELLLLACGAT